MALPPPTSRHCPSPRFLKAATAALQDPRNLPALFPQHDGPAPPSPSPSPSPVSAAARYVWGVIGAAAAAASTPSQRENCCWAAAGLAAHLLPTEQLVLGEVAAALQVHSLGF